MPGPTRIRLVGLGFDDEYLNANTERSLALGIPLIELAPPHGRPLAVVGGGPSFPDHLEELRAMPAEDVWAINGTAKALRRLGVESTAVTVDPTPDPALQEKLYDGIGQALFASSCAPGLFAMYEGRCRMFHMDHWGDEGIRAKGNATSASRLHFPAFVLGYSDISFFGCEGSCTESGHTHGYYHNSDDPNDAFTMTVEVEGVRYTTRTDLVMQGDFLAGLIREFPTVFKDRSGGLLAAMYEHPDTWSFVDIPEEYLPHSYELALEKEVA